MDAITIIGESPSQSRRRLSATTLLGKSDFAEDCKVVALRRRRRSSLSIQSVPSRDNADDEEHIIDQRTSSTTAVGAGSKKKKSVESSSRRTSLLTDFFARSTTSCSFRDKGIQPTVIIALIYLRHNHSGDDGIDVNHIRHVLGERLLEIPRFRSTFRLSADDGKVYCDLLPKEEVDLHHHIHTIDGNGSFGDDDVSELVSNACMKEWDASRPLWNISIVRNVGECGKDNDDDGNTNAMRSLLFCKIDHAIGDGVAMTSVLLSLLDDPPPDQTNLKTFQRRRVGYKPPLRLSHRIVTFGRGVYMGLVGWIMEGQDPPSSLKSVPPPRAPNERDSEPIKPPKKYFAQTKPFLLSKFKSIKNRLGHGTSVNDIILAVVTIALRKYFEATKDPILQSNPTLRAQFAVNARPNSVTKEDDDDEEEPNLRNDFILASFPLPLSYTSTIQAIWKCKTKADEFKISPHLLLMKHVSGTILQTLPEEMLVQAVVEASHKPTCFISNVMGPYYEGKLGGYIVDQLHFFASSGVGLYFGVLSYHGWIRISLSVDERIGANMKLLTKCVEDAYDDIWKTVMGSGEAYSNSTKDEKKEEENEPLMIERPDMTPTAATVLEVLVAPLVLAIVGGVIFRFVS